MEAEADEGVGGGADDDDEEEGSIAPLGSSTFSSVDSLMPGGGIKRKQVSSIFFSEEEVKAGITSTGLEAGTQAFSSAHLNHSFRRSASTLRNRADTPRSNASSPHPSATALASTTPM